MAMEINFKTETHLVDIPNVGKFLRRVLTGDGEVIGVEYLPAVFDDDSSPPEEMPQAVEVE